MTVLAVSRVQVLTTLHNAFEQLSRVAVFLEQARLGESLAQNEISSFERHLATIEDDNESGLYWILCVMHKLILSAGSQLDDNVINDVLKMNVEEVERNALRHVRDYIVLRDFEKLLDRLSIDFIVVRELLAVA